MYNQQREILIQQASSPSIIHGGGGGYLPQGSYNVRVASLKMLRENYVEIEFATVSGDIHKEFWYVENTVKGIGYTSEWKRFRAGILPNLKCQRILEEDLHLDKLIGLECIVDVARTAGWEIYNRNGNTIVLDETNKELSPWFNSLKKAYDHAGTLKMKRSMCRIYNIRGAQKNIGIFLNKFKTINEG